MLRKANKLRIQTVPHTTTFAVVARGTPPHTNLPTNLEYCDALNSWHSESTVISHNAQCIQQYWSAEKAQGREMAPYILYKKSEGRFELVQLNFDKPGNVRMGAGASKLPLDIYSHNADPKCLEYHLKSHTREFERILSANPRVQRHVNSIMRLGAFEALYRSICAELPISFQYPTMGIMHKLLPKPNYLSVNADLVHFHDNSAHIRLSKDQAIAVCPTREYIVNKLLELCQ